MVPIITHRDERKLFTVIGGVIVASVIALVQLEAARSGKPSPAAAVVTSGFAIAQAGVTGALDGVRSFGGNIGALPHLQSDNAALRKENAALTAENQRLHEALAEAPSAAAIADVASAQSGGIEAAVIGYDPENTERTITIDKGSQAGIVAESGVIDQGGAIGRVIEVNPFTSKVLLVTDPGSKVPAVVQRGRWWGIATGTNSRITLQYVSQDAKIKVGDVVVTGRGRSFGAGIPLGTVKQIFHPEGALYQTAQLDPTVSLGSLDRVYVLPKSDEAP